MAELCIALRCTPAEFWAMTYAEHQALVTAWNDAHRN